VGSHQAVVDWIRRLECSTNSRWPSSRSETFPGFSIVARRLRELIGARRALVSVPDPSGGFRVVATAAEAVAT
jgi:hypothetical protein